MALLLLPRQINRNQSRATMKIQEALVAGSVLVGAMFLAGCLSGRSSSDRSSSGGIDPITMQGIEDSNRATWEAAQRQSQEAIDQANLNAMQQSNQQAADAAAAASAAAAAAANQ